ncbi:MAG: rhodanese-like domain-containing protein [Planctomycetota bacterium]|jgi:rhodanese-related sulfurtransferase
MGWTVIVVLGIAVVAGIAVKLYVSRAGRADISQAQFQEWMEKKSELCILDVRSVREYNSGHVPGAINIGHTEISEHIDKTMPYKDKDVVVYCERGVRARMAQSTLVKSGFSSVYHLTGDMDAWRKAGLPTNTPDK